MRNETDAVAPLFAQRFLQKLQRTFGCIGAVDDVETLCTVFRNLSKLVELANLAAKARSNFNDRFRGLEVDFAKNSSGTIPKNFILANDLVAKRILNPFLKQLASALHYPVWGDRGLRQSPFMSPPMAFNWTRGSQFSGRRIPALRHGMPSATQSARHLS